MICPFEKIALDDLDRRTLKQLSGLGRWGKRFLTTVGIGGKIVRGLGRGAIGAGKGVARTAEFVGDQLVNHPTRTLTIGIPLAYNAYKLPERMRRQLNNVSPENPYWY